MRVRISSSSSTTKRWRGSMVVKADFSSGGFIWDVRQTHARQIIWPELGVFVLDCSERPRPPDVYGRACHLFCRRALGCRHLRSHSVKLVLPKSEAHRHADQRRHNPALSRTAAKTRRAAANRDRPALQMVRADLVSDHGRPPTHCRRRGRSRMLQDQPRHQDLSAGRCPNNRGRLFTLPASKQRNTTLGNKMKLNRRDVAGRRY